jgi:hypothetical protein
MAVGTMERNLTTGRKAKIPLLWLGGGYKLVFPALGRQRQEDQEFEASLVYILSLCFKKKKNKRNAQKEIGKESNHLEMKNIVIKKRYSVGKNSKEKKDKNTQLY